MRNAYDETNRREQDDSAPSGIVGPGRWSPSCKVNAKPRCQPLPSDDDITNNFTREGSRFRSDYANLPLCVTRCSYGSAGAWRRRAIHGSGSIMIGGDLVTLNLASVLRREAVSSGLQKNAPGSIKRARHLFVFAANEGWVLN